MIPLPDFLKAYQTLAEELLAQKRVKDVEFAGNTYQVQVVDPKEDQEVWAFIQLDKRGQIKDCFCSCESPEAKPSCVHLASAYLRIYCGHRRPLHERFQGSLWNQLLRLYADRIGVHSDNLSSDGKGKYTYVDETRQQICLIEGKTDGAVQYLKEIIDFRRRETEETSLKFSNLSQEELASWREGRPGFRLLYELSYWNDLAKWLMFLQDEEKRYEITFEYGEDQFPNWITIQFDELTLGFYLFKEELSKIIASLSTVNSPLTVYQVQEKMIESISYERSTGCLVVTPAKQSNVEAKKGIPFHDWLYVPKEGFYPLQEHTMVEKTKWCGTQVSELLDKHLDVVQGLLKEETIFAGKPLRFSYSVSFDPQWNLHVVSYLHEKGDLSQGKARDFGHWIYLENQGFYPIENRRFEQIDLVVPPEEVADFVRLHRGFLNHREGFHTHLTSIESFFTYQVTKERSLLFKKHMQVADIEERAMSREFGPYVYIAGRGFYPKSTSQLISPIHENLLLKESEIGNFLRQNREELETIPDFFSEKCPVGHVGVRVELTAEETILIKPVYSLYPEFRDKDVYYFDDFVFVQGEGFYELPADMRLPDRFRHEIELEPENFKAFFSYELNSLKRYASYIDHRLLEAEDLTLVAEEITRDFERGKEWYQLKLRYQSSWGTISALDLALAKQKKKRYIFSEAGLIDLEESRYDWLKEMNSSRYDSAKNTLALTSLELIKLNVFDEIRVLQTRNLIQELSDFHTPEDPDLTGLKSSLRPYQTIGVQWLWFLYQHNLSGLLCDDMGLGKTHQSMALMSAIVNENKGKTPHFLIVCPTSVLYHWQEKLAAFLPHLKVCTFYGTQRSLKEFKENYDVLLTSYGVWRIEIDLLKQIPFELAIFDEVQIAKNHSSRIHHSLSLVKANMRLGLTGTPIENYLRELKSLFDLVLPTYMPNHADYRRIFIKPIEKQEDPKRMQLLKRYINPFILRRKKDEVLVDLPAKTEEAFHCDLSADQKLLYIEMIEKSQRHLVDELQDNKAPIPYIHIFALLSHLKQICDHPAVFLKEPENYKQYQSGKWDLFLELLHEALDSQQKVVVYSQYLSMLDIIESYLKEHSIGFASIRGSTRNRGEEIQRFNQDSECKVFVGSLQAAGLGIDLTAASVVIHYDRWWNAARENQATDRIHRIGQTRGVQVFKLITKGTFEERIDSMIQRKGKLMEDIIGLDDHQVIKKFNREEILELLKYIEDEK